MGTNTDQPFIQCKLCGQMGNQLFQLAAAMAYSWDYQAIPYFPDLNNQEERLSYNRDSIFFRFNNSSPPRPILNTFTESHVFSSERIPFKKDLLICGHFLSWKHFNHHRDKILSLLTPSQKVMESLGKKYKNLLEKTNTVAIHVRTGNVYAHNQKINPFLGIKYFENSINHFKSDSEFIVFSDRINWCKKHFQKFEKNFVFIEGNDGILDFFLMSKMKSIITSNSTYSWWASYINMHPDKIIIAPHSFYDLTSDPNYPMKDSLKFNGEEFYLPEWKKIYDINFNDPYPSDMESYDSHSQSLN